MAAFLKRNFRYLAAQGKAPHPDSLEAARFYEEKISMEE